MRGALVIKEEFLFVRVICYFKGCIYLALLIYKCVLKATHCKIILFHDSYDQKKEILLK